MASTWFAAAAMLGALSAPGSISNEATITPPLAAPASVWTRVALTDAPARWRTPVCAGVTGLTGANAQFVVDRVSQRAGEVGLDAGAPGCTANLLIVFSADPDGQALAIARERTDPASLTGRSGASAGRVAFDAFVNADTPVRWWRVTRPMTEAGIVADRNVRAGEAPRVNVPERGRLASTTFDAFSHVIVIVDLNQVNGQRLDALADYIAMVALSPVEARADIVGGASILGLFNEPQAANAITEADMAYLARVYR